MDDVTLQRSTGSQEFFRVKNFLLLLRYDSTIYAIKLAIRKFGRKRKNISPKIFFIFGEQGTWK